MCPTSSTYCARTAAPQVWKRKERRRISRNLICSSTLRVTTLLRFFPSFPRPCTYYLVNYHTSLTTIWIIPFGYITLVYYTWVSRSCRLKTTTTAPSLLPNRAIWIHSLIGPWWSIGERNIIRNGAYSYLCWCIEANLVGWTGRPYRSDRFWIYPFTFPSPTCGLIHCLMSHIIQCNWFLLLARLLTNHRCPMPLWPCKYLTEFSDYTRYAMRVEYVGTRR